MARNLKALGLAVLAVLAMGVLVVPGAHGEEYIASEYPATISGEQAEGEGHVFTTAGGRQITCQTVIFSGILEEQSQEMSLEPTYDGCHAVILGSKLPATITSSAPCAYRYRLPAGGGNGASVDLECSLTVDVYGNHSDHTTGTTLCQLHVAPQNHLTFSTEFHHSGWWFWTKQKHITNISTTRTGSASCGASGAATYVGNTTLSATNEANEPVNVRVE